MANVIERNQPTYYELRRIAFQLDSANNIVAMADLSIRNADGDPIDEDHPATTLTPGEADTFKNWVLAKLAEYEDYTESLGRRLERWTP